MRASHGLALFTATCALCFSPTAPFLAAAPAPAPAASSSKTCRPGDAATRLEAGRRHRGGAAAGRLTGLLGGCSSDIVERRVSALASSPAQPDRLGRGGGGGGGGGEGSWTGFERTVSKYKSATATATLRRRRGRNSYPCSFSSRSESKSRLYQQKAPGLPEGDEGIADFASLANPAKDKDYGGDSALQYGVSVGAEAAGAGAAHHFFSADTRVVFGVNALEIGLVELYDMGLQRAMIVTGWNQARADPVVWELLPRGFDLKWHSVSAEPSLSDVAEGASLALEHRADCVVAMGGAAVIDAAKAIAAIVYADKDSAKAAGRLLSAAAKPREVERRTTVPGVEETKSADLMPLLGPVPLVAIPIIAGLGSEVTPMATILDDNDPLEPQKVTLGFHNTAAAMPAPFMAIVEPRLMMRVPLETTWPRAFVALAGCLESYVAGRGFVPDLLSHQGIERVSRCLARDLGFRGPLYEEREDIAYAGVIRGLVASRTEWSFLDRLASAVSVACSAPYANCVARLFPRVLEAQIAELRREETAFMDSAYRRRTRARRRDGAPAGDDGGSGDGGGGGKGREKTYSDDYNDRACAALLKYKRVAGFVVRAGGGAGEAGRTRKRSRKDIVTAEGDAAHIDTAGPSPEDMVEWLDARLLDKNIPPLYRTGLKLEHAPIVLETLRRGAGAGDRGVAEAAEHKTSTAFGGLGEAVVREIVVGEAGRSRTGGDGGGAGGESESADRDVEEASPEVAETMAAMFGEDQGRGQGQQEDQPQRGPWQQK